MLARLSSPRSIRTTVIAVLTPLLLTPVVVSSLATTADAAKPTGTFSVRSGATVTFTSMTVDACNTESGGFAVDGTFVATLADNTGLACSGPKQFPDVTWTNTSASPVTVTVLLSDSTCGVTYGSDGTSSGGTVSVDHATFKNNAVSIADAGSSCTLRDSVVQPTIGQGNFNVTLTFTHH